MKDMIPSQVAGAATEHRITLFDGSQRTVLTTDIETPFPEGKLIVSRTDTAGVITHCNQAFIDMSGYTTEELIGEAHSILRHPDMPKAAFADLWTTIATGTKWHGYVKNLRKDGGFYWVHAVVVPSIRDGKIVGYMSVRRKPSRTKVNEASALYVSLKAKESA